MLAFLIIVVVTLNSSYAEDLCVNCKAKCDKDTGTCRGRCKPLFYGEKCHLSCSACERRCDKLTGECENCPLHKYGKNCENVCSNGCKHGCNRTDGTCTKCKLNYYGPFCDKRCSDQCLHPCDRKGVCDSCRGNNYWGPKCDKPCKENCHENRCHQTSGKCSSCKPGYWGDFCESKCTVVTCKKCLWDKLLDELVCKSCVNGYYGGNCDKRCSENCADNVCYKSNGECHNCRNGWFGKMCNQKCFTNCAKCRDTTTCKVCIDGFYGIRCEQRCPVGCSRCSRDGHRCLSCDAEDNNASHLDANCRCSRTECTTDEMPCDGCKSLSFFNTEQTCCPCEIRKCANKQTENCAAENNTMCSGQCQPGYYGSYCARTCSSHCRGDSHLCEQDTGHCTERCEAGWLGLRCDVHCKHFLPHCTNCTTFNSQKLDSYGARCIDCEKGYYLRDVYFDECLKCENCANDICDPKTGACLQGCQKGYFQRSNNHCDGSCKNCIEQTCHDNGTCTKPGCKAGYYGRGCSYQCSTNCKNVSCDESGKCAMGCQKGYHGDKCQSKCKNCLNDNCNEKTGECLECKPAFWGKDCKQSCRGCIDRSCSHPDGCREGCKPGFYSKFCDKSCPTDCTACDQLLGTCTICKTQDDNMCLKKQKMPWVLSLKFPNTRSCNNGMYGPDCDIACPSGCSAIGNGVLSCDRFTGTCLLTGCRQGFFGMYCERNCTNCKMKDALTCERSSGDCLQGCQQGWAGVKCEEREDESLALSAWQMILVVVLPVMAVLVVVVLLIIYCKPRKGKNQYVPSSTDETL